MGEKVSRDLTVRPPVTGPQEQKSFRAHAEAPKSKTLNTRV